MIKECILCAEALSLKHIVQHASWDEMLLSRVYPLLLLNYLTGLTGSSLKNEISTSSQMISNGSTDKILMHKTTKSHHID